MSTSRRLLGLIAPFKGWIALAVLLSFATLGSSVGLIAFSAYLISKSAVVASTSEISAAIVGVRIFAVSRAVSRYFERYTGHLATFRILTRLRVWFYRSIEPLAPARLAGQRSGDLLTRIGADVETLQEFYLRVVVPPIAAGLTVLLATGILGSFDIRLGLALLGFLVLTGVVLPLVTRWLGRDGAEATIRLRADLNATVVDGVQGMADLVAYGRQQAQAERIAAITTDLDRVQERLAVLRGASNGLAALFTGLASVTVLGLAVPLVTSGALDPVFLAIMPLTAIASFEAVQPLSLALQHLDRSRAAASRLFELIDAEPAVHDPDMPFPPPQRHDLELRHVTFRYAPDEAPALLDVSAAIPEGAWVAVVGPSGSGKSSLVALLLRFWDYDEGQIRLGGTELHDLAQDDVRAALAVVAQHDHLFDTTIADNLRLASSDATAGELEDACRVAGIHDWVASLPAGYASRVGEDGVRVSGGERQRLLLARALLKDAPILVLDEATAHLDPPTERAVLERIRQVRHGRTTIVISHHADVMDGVDLVLRLDRGRCRVEQRGGGVSLSAP